MKVAKHIFDTPDGKDPLIYENELGDHNKNKRWITSVDLEYMTLVMIYSLLRLALGKNVLVIAAAELTKTGHSDSTERSQSQYIG
jgi:hypothetical protein